MRVSTIRRHLSWSWQGMRRRIACPLLRDPRWKLMTAVPRVAVWLRVYVFPGVEPDPNDCMLHTRHHNSEKRTGLAGSRVCADTFSLFPLIDDPRGDCTEHRSKCGAGRGTEKPEATTHFFMTGRESCRGVGWDEVRNVNRAHSFFISTQSLLFRENRTHHREESKAKRWDGTMEWDAAHHR